MPARTISNSARQTPFLSVADCARPAAPDRSGVRMDCNRGNLRAVVGSLSEPTAAAGPDPVRRTRTRPVAVPDAAHFASWLQLCPNNKITGGKIISSQTGPGSNRAAQALRWATQSLYRSPTALGESFRRKRARLGTPKAVTATAHKMARIIYHLVTDHVAYDDRLLDTHQRQDRKRLERRLRNQARALGFELVPEAA